MASPLVDYQKLFGNTKILMFDHDPGGTSATVVTPDGGTTKQFVDMQEFEGFAVAAMPSTLTGAGITLLEIVGNTLLDGSGTTVQITTSGAVVGDAVGDLIVQECSVDMLKKEGLDQGTPVDLRFAGGRLTMANAADEAVVTYIQYGARYPQKDLTANVIA